MSQSITHAKNFVKEEYDSIGNVGAIYKKVKCSNKWLKA